MEVRVTPLLLNGSWLATSGPRLAGHISDSDRSDLQQSRAEVNAARTAKETKKDEKEVQGPL